MSWEHIINLKDYTPLEHVLFATGALLWVFTYIIVIKNIRKFKFIEIPIVAVCANFSWEFLWSFVFTTDMGELYVWGYRIWFFLDCYIVFGLFKYGWKQTSLEEIKKHYHLIVALCLAAWFACLYYYIDIYDAPITHMGANSGYILNVMMSALYPILLLRMNSLNGFSYLGGWFKGVGTFLITIFCFLKFPDHSWLLVLCAITTVLDAWYIYLFSVKRKKLGA